MPPPLPYKKLSKARVLSVFMYNCSNAALVLSAFIDNKATHSFISNSLGEKLDFIVSFKIQACNNAV